MEGFMNALKHALRSNDKAEAHRLVSTYLADDAKRLKTFYEVVIPTILNEIDCDEDDMACVFIEHRMSAIARSLVESQFMRVVEHAKRLEPSRHVMIACIQDETHDLGAVVGEHLFRLYGFETTYIGANTPLDSLRNALVQLEDVDYVVLSATNAYNLSRLKKVVEALRTEFPDIRFFGAGRAVRSRHEWAGLDGIIDGSEAIERLIEEEGLKCSP